MPLETNDFESDEQKEYKFKESFIEVLTDNHIEKAEKILIDFYEAEKLNSNDKTLYKYFLFINNSWLWIKTIDDVQREKLKQTFLQQTNESLLDETNKYIIFERLQRPKLFQQDEQNSVDDRKLPF